MDELDPNMRIFFTALGAGLEAALVVAGVAGSAAAAEVVADVAAAVELPGSSVVVAVMDLVPTLLRNPESLLLWFPMALADAAWGTAGGALVVGTATAGAVAGAVAGAAAGAVAGEGSGVGAASLSTLGATGGSCDVVPPGLAIGSFFAFATPVEACLNFSSPAYFPPDWAKASIKWVLHMRSLPEVEKFLIVSWQPHTLHLAHDL